MKTLTYLSFVLLAFMTACSPSLQPLTTSPSNSINQTMTDKKGKIHLLGLSNRKGLQTEPFAEWFNKYYDTYQPSSKILKKQKSKTKDVQILAFMGTWCGDSKREVPRFYKVFDQLDFDEKQITLVNLDRKPDAYKQSPTGEEKGLNIHRVPTFIVYRDGQEIGRIVESPVTSMETDLVQILNGMPTRPNYPVVSRVNFAFENNEFEKLEEDAKKWGNYVRRNAKSSSELNTYGYVLASANQLEKAIIVFRLNTLGFPKDANTFDSLGEAYKENGQHELAIINYEKALELDPESKTAKEMLAELRALN